MHIQSRTKVGMHTHFLLRKQAHTRMCTEIDGGTRPQITPAHRAPHKLEPKQKQAQAVVVHPNMGMIAVRTPKPQGMPPANARRPKMPTDAGPHPRLRGCKADMERRIAQATPDPNAKNVRFKVLPLPRMHRPAAAGARAGNRGMRQPGFWTHGGEPSPGDTSPDEPLMLVSGNPAAIAANISS